jgi:molybdopterin converting factor small subunit
MKISVIFRGAIARKIEGGIVEVDLGEGCTLRELFSRILEQNSCLQDVWNNPVEIDRDSMILCNEVDVGVTGGLETALKNGDTLTVLPLVHGG